MRLYYNHVPPQLSANQLTNTTIIRLAETLLNVEDQSLKSLNLAENEVFSIFEIHLLLFKYFTK